VVTTAPTVTFSQTTPYRFAENAGSAQVELVLSNPSSTDITLQVLSTDGTAIGKYVITVSFKIIVFEPKDWCMHTLLLISALHRRSHKVYYNT